MEVHRLIFIIIVFVSISLYLFMHLFLLKKAIKSLKNDFIMVKNNKEAERHIQINFPDRDLEELAIEINDYVSLYFNNNYQFAKNVSEIKGEITNISHDLRTPLTSILGYLDRV